MGIQENKDTSKTSSQHEEMLRLLREIIKHQETMMKSQAAMTEALEMLLEKSSPQKIYVSERPPLRLPADRDEEPEPPAKYDHIAYKIATGLVVISVVVLLFRLMFHV